MFNEETLKWLIPVLVTLFLGILGVGGTIFYFKRNALAKVVQEENTSEKGKIENSILNLKLRKEETEFEFNEEIQEFEHLEKVLKIAKERGEEVASLTTQAIEYVKQLSESKKQIQQLETEKYRLEGQLLYQEEIMERTFKKNDKLMEDNVKTRSELDKLNGDLSELKQEYQKVLNKLTSCEDELAQDAVKQN